jgi:hypothetical protein
MPSLTLLLIGENMISPVETLKKQVTVLEMKKKEILNSLHEVESVISDFMDSIMVLEHAEDPEYKFEELNTSPIPAGECTNELADMKYRKEGDHITIRKAGDCLNTSWIALNDFYHSLPDRTNTTQITGINVKKRNILVSFFAEHVNFPCHVERKGLKHIIIKDQVSVKVETKPVMKAEPEVSSY